MLTNDPMEVFAGTPEILDCILQNLSENDLKICLQVSKAWRGWAIKLLSRKRFFAEVRDTCENVEALNCIIPKISFVNGLRIKVPLEHTCSCKEEAKVSDLCCGDLRRKPWRYLDLCTIPCVPLQHCMNDLLRASCETVEEIKITYLKRAGEIHSRALIANNINCLFPKLHTIKIEPEFDAPIDDLVKFIPLAHNLRYICGLITLDDVAILERRCYPFLTEVHCMATGTLNKTFKNLVASQPKLKHLQIYDTDEEVVPTAWSRQLGNLLCESTLTLKRLSICAIELLKVVLEAGLQFKNLEDLELFLPEHATMKNFEKAAGALNLPLNFPSLLNLRLKFGENCYHPIPRKHVSRAITKSQAKSVRSMILEDPPCNADAICMCAKYFPMLNSFGFELLACAEVGHNLGQNHKYDVSAIWKGLPLLERLKICMKDEDIGPDDFTLDEFFCGISNEEAGMLLKDYRTGALSISALQLCPLNPCISYASRLKEVCLVFAPSYKFSKFCISEVSVHVAFARLPHVALRVRCFNLQVCEELGCLSPVGEISYLLGGRDWW